MARVTRRRFSDAFKCQAVARRQTNGLMPAEVAGESGLLPTMLRRWRRQLQESDTLSAKPPVSTMASPADRASEIARLRRDLDRAPVERDILKKAVGIFAEMPR